MAGTSREDALNKQEGFCVTLDRSAFEAERFVCLLRRLGMSGQSGADDGVVRHDELCPLELHGADIHKPMVNLLGGVVCVEDDAQDALLVGEERVMTRANQFVAAA